MLPQAFLEKLDTLPAQPGCYLFKDKKGEVVYVGKAKSLRSRVRSYFQQSSGDERYFIPVLQRTVGDFETVVTGSEKEAAILEDSLIKEYRPRYNVKLRDDKSYLCLRIDVTHEWPRVEPVRRPSQDKARYFGPYHSATAARRTLHLVNKHFQLRTCTDQDLTSRKRPCLQYQIRRCLAPCVYDVDKQWYKDQVRAVGLFLDGRHDELSSELGDRMKTASKQLEFELAATYRDQLRAVEAIRQEQRVVAIKDVDQDVVGMYREGDLVEISVLFIRSGRVTDTAHFPMRGVELPDEEVIGAFVSQFYGEGGNAVTIPGEVLVPTSFDGDDGVAEWLSDRRGKRCDVAVPQRGAKADLMRLAYDNAEHAFREERRAADDVEERLAQVQKRLRLPALPRRIECCDISHLGGTDTVGAIVALKDGLPDKKRYRTFRVKTVAHGDDYGAMYEVLARRFRRGRAAEEAVARDGAESEAEAEGTRDRIDWDLPDLFVVDGGRGQLNVALTAARDLGLHGLPIVALAKEKSIPGYPGRGFDDDNDDDEGEEPPPGDVTTDTDPPAISCGATQSAQSSGPSASLPSAETIENRAASSAAAASGVATTSIPTGNAATSSDARDATTASILAATSPPTGDAATPAALSPTHEGREDSSGISGSPERPKGKERRRTTSSKPKPDDMVDRVYLPGQKNGIPLRPNSAALFFLARARDEAHRFSNRARERLGKARKLRSELDDIPGIGPVTRQAVLRTLGSLDAIRRASDEALLKVPGVSQRTLRALRAYFPAPPTADQTSTEPTSPTPSNAPSRIAPTGSPLPSVATPSDAPATVDPLNPRMDDGER